MPATATSPTRTSRRRLGASMPSPISPKTRPRKIAALPRRSDRLAINALKRSLEAPVGSDANKPTATATAAADTVIRRSKRVIEKVIKDYEESPSAGKRQLKKAVALATYPSITEISPVKRELKKTLVESKSSVMELPRREPAERAIEFELKFPASPEPQPPAYALRNRATTSRAARRH